jgi:hypothetical protein
MTKRQKAVERLLSKPTDYTWDELRSVMKAFGYEMRMTGGSGRKFIHPDTRETLYFHEPHPLKLLKLYQVRDAIQFLREQGHLQ